MITLNVCKKISQKKILIACIISFFMLLIPTTIIAQDDMKSLDSLAEIAISNGNFAGGYLLRTKQIDTLSKQVNKGDSNLIRLIANRGMCLERIKKFDEALIEEKKAVELWTKFQDTTSYTYASLLSNLSICQIDVNQLDAAIENSQKSISILETLPKTTMTQWMYQAKTYINKAEVLAKAKRFKEAITEEWKGLEIFRRYYGNDTSPYLKELTYLQKYLKESGNEEEADKIAIKLEEGAADLRLPKVKEFASAEEASKYNKEAIYCCNYYLDHPITAPKMIEAGQFFENWNNLSKDVRINMGKFEHDLLQSQGGSLCYLAYEASMITNELRNNVKFDKVIYLAAIVEVTGFYVDNKQSIGLVATLEPFAKVYSIDNPKPVLKLAEEQYDALMKLMKENRNTKLQ